MLGVFTGCDQNTTSGNNTVTITPTVTNKPAEKDLQPGLDKSPMDMSYYPVDYPKLKMAGNLSRTIRLPA
jgi:hypothetical protein